MADTSEPRLDRPPLTVAKLSDVDDSRQYWLSRPVGERLAAIELLRRTFYGDRAEEPIKRVLEVAQLPAKVEGSQVT